MDAKAVSSSIAKFSAKFFNELDKTKSVVSSPLSAETVLALLTICAEDPAHKELISSLGIPDDDAIQASFALVSTKLKEIQGVKLDVANRVYIKEGNYNLNPQLKKDAVKIFDTKLKKINFDDGAKAAHTVNKWVESKTNKRVKGLLSDNSFNSNTRLVFINALYFKGTWNKQFNPKSTRNNLFNIDNQRTIEIPMMCNADIYKYGESESIGAQMLQLFYKGNKASMFVVLPREVTGLDAVLQKLADGYDLLAELDNMYETNVQVTLPKFKIETEIDLNELLPKLGITSIFNPGNSGLTKILNTDEPLVVSKAVQKAFIEVNEEGAEAAAATAGVTYYYCSYDFKKPRLVIVCADRPFLITILIDDTVYIMAAYRGSE